MQIESDEDVIRDMTAILDRTIFSFESGVFKWVNHEALDQEFDDGCRCAVQAIYDEIHPEIARSSSHVTHHVMTYLALEGPGDPLDCLAQWNDHRCESQEQLVSLLRECRAKLTRKEA